MTSVLSKYEVADTSGFPVAEKDTSVFKQRIKPDTVITDSTTEPADTVHITPITERIDSAYIIPDTAEIKQTVPKKIKPAKSSDTLKLEKHKEPPAESKPLINIVPENYLTHIKADNEKCFRNSILLNNVNKLTTGQNTEIIKPEKRNDVTNDWYLGIILFIVMLFMWIKIFYNKYFTLLFNSLLNYQISLKLLREKSVLTKRVSFALNLIYIIVLALFILKFLEFYQIKLFKFNNFELLLVLINMIILLSVARILILNIIGFLFNSNNIFNEYIHNNYIINKNLGLFLFPLVFIQVYMSEKLTVVFIIAGIILIFLSYILRLYRGFQIIIKKDIFLFYLILYLCTLEILPLLLGYKLFKSLI